MTEVERMSSGVGVNWFAGFTNCELVTGTQKPDTSLWYPTGQLCELPIGTHTPEESVTYPTGHWDKDWPCTWL